MSLQDLFYIVGLFYMTMCIVLLLSLVVAVFYIKKKVGDLEHTFEKKLEIISQAASHPAEAAVGIGASLAEAAVDRIKEALEGKGKKKN